jgi:hypothetical protein
MPWIWLCLFLLLYSRPSFYWLQAPSGLKLQHVQIEHLIFHNDYDAKQQLCKPPEIKNISIPGQFKKALTRWQLGARETVTRGTQARP